MGDSVFITCAITGAGDTVAKSDKVPVTPSEIAASSIEAAKAGAAVVHIHVRDPETGRPTERLLHVHQLRPEMAALGEIESAAPPAALIASSTSGIKPSTLQAKMAHPERLVVGHPFNPVSLIPLVEVVGGATHRRNRSRPRWPSGGRPCGWSTTVSQAPPRSTTRSGSVSGSVGPDGAVRDLSSGRGSRRHGPLPRAVPLAILNALAEQNWGAGKVIAEARQRRSGDETARLSNPT